MAKMNKSLEAKSPKTKPTKGSSLAKKLKPEAVTTTPMKVKSKPGAGAGAKEKSNSVEKLTPSLPAKKTPKKKKENKEAVSAPVAKALKNKKSTPVEDPVEDEDAEQPPPAPSRKRKAEDQTIMAGTTIDQVPGFGKKKKLTKREKHAKHVKLQKKESKHKETKELVQYLNVWKNNREKWKFEKLKQIHIQNFIFDESKITDVIFPTAVEYLSGTTGSFRDKLIQAAKEVITTGDKADGGIEDSKYQRARQVLQSLV